MEEVDREISEMKLSLNARARIVAESYLTAVRNILPPILAGPDITYIAVQHINCNQQQHFKDSMRVFPGFYVY